MDKVIALTGNDLTIESLFELATSPRFKVTCSSSALQDVARCAAEVEKVASAYSKNYERLVSSTSRSADNDDAGGLVLDYGITTGFGEFKRIPIPPSKLLDLQRNIIVSHATGVGNTSDFLDCANYYPPSVVRAALALRLNTFLRGNSGVRLSTIYIIERMINQCVVPLVPLHGSVGSSGDLAPLSHLFLPLVMAPEARFHVPGSHVEDLRKHRFASQDLRTGADFYDVIGMTIPNPVLSYKEGLALTNGAVFSAAMLGVAVYEAEMLAKVSDIALAMSLESVGGCARAFDPNVHDARPHVGQVDSARCIRLLVEGSGLVDSAAADVQDCYSIRCAPQVHGASREVVSFARGVVEREMNSSTDNPLLFPQHDDLWDYQFEKNWPESNLNEKGAGIAGYDGRVRSTFSAGNFHGQPIGMAADFLAMGIAEFANISERRIQMLLDAHHNRGLPANLVPDGGVNSGFMIAQYCAAGLVSENKVLCHPATVDSIPVSANSEDHNSMSTVACRKLVRVLQNARNVIAIELMVATQALDWRLLSQEIADNVDRSTQKSGVSAFGATTRQEIGSETFVARVPLSETYAIGRLGRGTIAAWSFIRRLVAPLTVDRVLADDIRILLSELEGRSLVDQVESRLQRPLAGCRRLMWASSD